ncbi:MAG: cyclic nucleotide-binding protein, partial [Acidimicrobiales bacterium]
MTDAAHVPGLGLEETADRHGAFPRINSDQLARLGMLGELLTTVPGDVLYRNGDATYDFYVVKSGTVTVVEGYMEEDRVIGVIGALRFL